MRNKKLLPAIILLLGIGFALVSTTLYITGNIKIATNNADFNVKFTKAVLDGTNISTTAISSDGKTLEYGTSDLKNVGDISKLDFEVTNNSEMYDANITIDCTAAGDKSSYYEITKEVASPIAGKRTEAGKVEVKLLKASVTNFSETFTCTLNATSAERTTKAESAPLPLKYTPKYFEFGNPTTESTQDYTTLKYTGTETSAKVFVGLDADESQKSVCIVRNGSLECFKINNYEEEKDHIQQVFSDISCDVRSSYVDCGASDFFCCIRSDGRVYCSDKSEYSDCYVYSDGSVNCG